MKRSGMIAAALLGVACLAQPAWSKAPSRVVIRPQTQDAALVRTWTPSAVRTVERFFGRPFPRPLEVFVATTRRDFASALPAEWGLGETQCWMVGAGSSDRLVMLSPTTWRTEACEHDPDDLAEAKRIYVHELVHSYHGQHNASGDFSEVVGMDWFIEGLAAYASGQMGPERGARIRLLAREGGLPKTLDDIWKGRDKYAQAGSLVAYIDARYGRGQLRRLLPVQSRGAALAMLGVDEPTLLSNWARWAVDRGARAVPGAGRGLAEQDL